eukprot:TRINITY_DN5158_c0_g1_i5.p2 TRINITY_DN5158_c0_g1~~TRINITY_DN5158_c0_g1_i5.p2  ORF type:complete len:150 (-),score=27.86 TRINITY_DN5158_c0_g1_i5:169-618(-)
MTPTTKPPSLHLPTRPFFELAHDLDTTLYKLLYTLDMQKGADVAKNHVVEGAALMAENLEDGMLLDTLAGKNELMVKLGEEGVMIKSGNITANVIKGDIKAGKAIIHVVDTVLVPHGGSYDEEFTFMDSMRELGSTLGQFVKSVMANGK